MYVCVHLIMLEKCNVTAVSSQLDFFVLMLKGETCDLKKVQCLNLACDLHSNKWFVVLHLPLYYALDMINVATIHVI